MWNICLYFLTIFVFFANSNDAKLFARIKRQTNLFGNQLPQNNMPEPLGFGDITKVLMDPKELHKRLHRMTTSPAVSKLPNVNLFDDPGLGLKSGPKQPFLFHIAQDFFSAAVNFLFQFML